MAFLHIKNVSIRGVAACVPSKIEENAGITNIPDLEKLIKTIGVERRHMAKPETCTSDLCFEAAQKLIEELNWDKNDIEGLVFVSQTPDYILPATSPLLQNRLGLPHDCFTLDISLGCSGYIYGLSTLAGYMQTGGIKKALLLVGDTSTKVCSADDKITYPLFGDAGTATALEYSDDDEGFLFHLGSDGGGYKSIIINDGSYRNPYNNASLEMQHIGDGISRNNLQLTLDGMDVFSFGISKAPETVNSLISKFDINKDSIDYFFFHQANQMMNERIRKKLQLPEEKVPYSLKDFGNTSSASIPLTMVTQSAAELKNGDKQIIACGFGVGLSWGSVKCSTKNLIIPHLIYHG
ncbi:ketoacyl-ACP synthase III [Mucilaginibacter pocheonensis]|uniref:3-oxoacyl-[acyl-carrier-protein] synthase-3 n=1 Tax=Mucilaginibacter pocheonensis TaxID=398050 RepID=A0ABU1T558_9SPHI|nr:ketoacyl-ACP synthase III [Mucilaginibacter pocheonensis]MDR6940429.1 3-oxoacyl-[acyl-carrier-protein] synthase-3 [Mucilaginibacter pocheonensis]